MSTIVLARKYRPRRFAEMVGQEHVVQALTNALNQQRLHHAYLFTGTRGIGKTTVSRILAKSLNCTGADGTGGITADPCGVCSACTEIDADRYIDYIELDAASNRSIDEIRDLIERAAYKPGVGRFKVFMIDEAHQLTKDAFNALLKTLEEPPDYLKFVLATTDPEKMLPTVLSRCLQFNLRPMAPDTVREHLQRVLEAEAVAAEDGALRLLARAARGSMRDGLSLADQAIAYGGGQLTEDGVRRMLGSVDRGHVRRLLQALAQRDGTALLAAVDGVDGLRALGLSANGTLEAMALLLQQMAVDQAVPGALDAGDPETEDARQLSPLLAPDETQMLYSMVLHGREELSLMGDEYAALTMVLLRFLAFPTASGSGLSTSRSPPEAVPTPAAAPVSAPAAAPSSVPAPTRQVAAPVPLPRPAPLRAAGPPALSMPAQPPAEHASRAPPVTDTVPPALGSQWHGLVMRLCSQGTVMALVRELALQSGLVSTDQGVEPACWHLRVERESLRSPVLRDKLATALAAELGHTVDLRVEAGVPDDSPALREAAERDRRQAAAEASIRQDPLVRELLSQYKGARIVPGSIKPLPTST
ncbi:MAG: DNA polymerase III subunit gamma/tau [Rubrivivax sp.]